MNDLEALWAVEEDERIRRSDPLERWRASSEAQDFAIRHWLKGVWVYAHAGNRSGKTEGFMAAVLAMATGRNVLRGYREPIPVQVLDPTRGPALFILAGESYKALSIGAIQTIRNLLGTWDYHEEKAGGQDSVAVFRIRHRLARDESQWSRLYVFPYDGALPEGPGLDGWVCDEPPPERFLTALVSRVRAGRTLRAGIPATPREKTKWWHISERFPKQRRVIVNGRVRVQWAAFENEALKPADRAQLQALASGDRFERAILYGDEINVVGGNPWPGIDWTALLAACVSPRIEQLTVEGDAGGGTVRAVLQVWESPIAGETYYVVGDPAKGIRSEKHDPDGMHVRRRSNKALVARLSGYLGGWALGNVMADMHIRYNHALCDPLTTGGYGEALVQALRKRKVFALTHDRIEVNPGDWQDRIGTVETHELRGKIVGAVDRSLRSGDFVCPSADIVTCLMDCTVDENGKVLASLGSHDEDFICWGRGDVYMGQWDAPKVKLPAPKRWENPNVRILKAIEKRDEAIALKYAPKIGPQSRPNRKSGNGVVSIEP